MSQPPISGVKSRTVDVHGSAMHYLEAGSGSPIVFIHGNPTSSYLWRTIVPQVAGHGRCIALDLIGMGHSAAPPIAYRLEDHIHYLDGFLDALDLHDITFVLHDWGVVLGLHVLARFPGRVAAVAFMEGHLHPVARWSDLDSGGEALFRRLRSAGEGRRLVIDENLFIESILPSGILRTLSATEMDAYRDPYRLPERREPLWRWPQEIPIEGKPPEVHAIMANNQKVIASTPIPKLLLYGTPDAIIGPTGVDWCRDNLRNFSAVNIGPGLHFLPEDQPDAIAAELVRWIDRWSCRPDRPPS